jgi:hypothetical protein
MGSGFDNSIHLDFHLAELQLFVTQSCTTYTKDVIFSGPVFRLLDSSW